MMDYRELENRLARNKEIIREREHDRLVELALGQHEANPLKRWSGLKGILSRMLLRRVKQIDTATSGTAVVIPRLQER